MHSCIDLFCGFLLLAIPTRTRPLQPQQPDPAPPPPVQQPTQLQTQQQQQNGKRTKQNGFQSSIAKLFFCFLSFCQKHLITSANEMCCIHLYFLLNQKRQMFSGYLTKLNFSYFIDHIYHRILTDVQKGAWTVVYVLPACHPGPQCFMVILLVFPLEPERPRRVTLWCGDEAAPPNPCLS